MKYKSELSLKRTILYVLMIFFALLAVIPIYLMLINATIEEIHDDYLMVSCTNSPKMIKVIYSKNNLSNFKEKQKIAIFFASTNTSTLSGVRIKILE